MQKFDCLIVGGGIAGTTAAETIRNIGGGLSVAIVSDEPYRLYSRIMLSKPNFFLEKIPFDNVWLKKEEWYAENNVALLSGRKAVRLDSAAKIVSLDDGTDINYEKLLLALGGCARRWNAPGSDKKGVYYLRTLDEAKGIITAAKSAKLSVVIGGGFVGFEMCDMMRLAGIGVTLVIRERHFWQNLLDETSGRMIENALEKGGVNIIRNSEAVEVTGGEAADGVVLKDGKKLPCDMIVAGIGIVYPCDWVKSAGIEVNRGIVTNEYLETNAGDIWAAGDSTEFNDVVLGERVQLGNWVNAQMQGKVAGANMAGAHDKFKMVSFYTTTGFGLTIAMVGNVRAGGNRKIIARGSFDENSYCRIIIKGAKIAGATLINRTQEMGTISKLIGNGTDISAHESDLSDSGFDLKSLL